MLLNGDKFVIEVSEDILSNMNEIVFVVKYNDILYLFCICFRENGDCMLI